jgi:hypothetical protein
MYSSLFEFYPRSLQCLFFGHEEVKIVKSWTFLFEFYSFIVVFIYY